MASPSHTISPAPFCEAAASTLIYRSALLESPPIWLIETESVLAASASSMPAASASVMAFLVTAFNASPLANNCGCCEPMSLKASATWLALNVVLAPSSMEYSFSLSRSAPTMPVSDDSCDMDFSKFLAVSMLLLNAEPIAPTAAVTLANRAAVVSRLPLICFNTPPIDKLSFLNWSSCRRAFAILAS